MSARSFRSVGWVAGVAATALGCYMVNLKVASERAALEDVETRIVLAERDIRLLQTEIGTRGRLAQLEKWNVKVLALSAPAANQFMDGSFQLATLVAPKEVLDPAAPMVLASAPAPKHEPVLSSDAAVATPEAPAARPSELMHVAGLKRDTPVVTGLAATALKKVAEKPKIASAADEKPAKPVKPVKEAAATKPREAPAKSLASAAKPEKKAATATAAKQKPKADAKLTAAAKPKPTAEPKPASAPKSKSQLNTAATSKPNSKEAKARQ